MGRMSIEMDKDLKKNNVDDAYDDDSDKINRIQPKEASLLCD